MSSDPTRPNRKPPWKRTFLAALAAEGTVVAAAKAAGRNRSYCYEAREADAAFARAWDEIDGAVADALEAEAIRRAQNGVDRDVYYQGQVVGQERQFSDSLLQFLLRGKRPEVYADRTRLDVAGVAGRPVEVLVIPDDADRAVEVARILAEAGAIPGAAS